MINGIDLENITKSDFPEELMNIIRGTDAAFPHAGMFLKNTLIGCMNGDTPDNDNFGLVTITALLIYELDKTNTKLEALRKAHNASLSNLL